MTCLYSVTKDLSDCGVVLTSTSVRILPNLNPCQGTCNDRGCAHALIQTDSQAMRVLAVGGGRGGGDGWGTGSTAAARQA